VITAVETNILLDVLILEAQAMETSQQLLDACLQQGSLVMSEVVYAELAAHFPTPEELESFLAATSIRLMPSQPPVLARPGQAWSGYVRRRRRSIACPACGRSQQLFCRHCGVALRGRQHLVSDFLVGGMLRRRQIGFSHAIVDTIVRIFRSSRSSNSQAGKRT
jgi:hypothetical protein